ncbi:thioredoxin domain-containing protein [Pseudidiomarina sp. CB1]|uniref:thioredoxin domain-containing protein n=1 Tax=Pseudidiomarina sp. CB1 TaxID=2972484 RepID=UPI002161F2F8|nr:thioredoxin domain-containing protein [Pseudidiomarina sp. CB1]
MTFKVKFILASVTALLLLACGPAQETSGTTKDDAQASESDIGATSKVAQELDPTPDVVQEFSATDFVEGKDYRVLDAALTLADFEKSPGEAGFVMEFLWPGCPHCQHFNPTINAYALEYTDVAVVKRAAPANERWAYDSRVFYTLREVAETNLDDEMIEFYQRTRETHNRLPSPEDIQGFMTEHGIDGEAFAAAFENPAQTDKLRKIMTDMMDAEVTSVPTLVVNGKYVITASAPHSPAESQRYFALVNHLLELE